MVIAKNGLKIKEEKNMELFSMTHRTIGMKVGRRYETV